MTAMVARLALAYVAVLPVAQIVVVPVEGALATASDVALLALVLAGAVAVVGEMLPGRRPSGGGAPERAGLDPLGGAYRIPLLLLALFAGWVALSGLWGFHPAYAGAKGAGVLLLVAGAYVLAVSGAGAARLADAWLVGAALAVLATLVGAVAPAGVRAWVLYGPGLVEGLPFPRVQGPFVHPNLFGDYLAASGLLLWARWPAWSAGRARTAGIALAGGIGVALLLTVSSGWMTAGAGLLALSVGAPGWSRRTRWAAGTAGAVISGMTVVGALFPLEVAVGPLRLATGGIRPAIWADAAVAVASSPLIGVGAAPYLAETADPLAGGAATTLWDAHSTYLSVAGQFGLVGALLFFGGLALAVRGLRPGRAVESEGAAPAAPFGEHLRLRLALLAVAAGVALHWTSIAGEEFRHLWVLVGIAGALVVSDR